MLESTGSCLGKVVHKLGIDIGEFDQGDTAHQSEHLLKQINHSVRTYNQYRIDGKEEIDPGVDGLERAVGIEEKDGIRTYICSQYPARRLRQLGALGYIPQRGYGYTSSTHLYKEEEEGLRRS